MDSLEESIAKFKKKIGVINHDITPEQISEILDLVSNASPSDKISLTFLQKVTTEITNYNRGYLFTEARDMSDIKHIFKEIQKELEKRRNKNS